MNGTNVSTASDEALGRPCRRVLMAGFGVLALTLPALRDAAAQPAGQQPAPTVLVMRVERQSISRAEEFIGRVEAVGKVDVRARITGFLQRRHFDEGQEVKEGDLLFTLEQAPFAAEVALREAEVARANADLRNASLQVERGRELVRTNAIARSTLDERIATEGIAQADVAAAQARLEQARIQYGYTEIRSPLSGRAGRSPLTPGNVVSPESGILVTVVRDDPVRVLFPMTQRMLLRFRRGEGEQNAEAVRVGVRLSDGRMLDSTGRIEFINVTTERATDSVLIQAVVPNPRRMLSDGQAVTAVVEAEQPQQAILLPQSAVQVDQAGAFVLVVGQDNKVEVKRVRTARAPGGQVMVTEGLEVGQLVITEGSQRARPGAPVNPRPAEALPGAAAPVDAARGG